ncbi:MAG: BspA family leucine-rich repeat surface protein [Bacteroidaceae bacterium]|nr:BspA family leucine-rich repeat surface protein [Bacteroidaceae bacterium]
MPEVSSAITTVVFDDSFAEVKPRSMYWWFMGFQNLTTVEGIEYLNTSECTNMNSMFFQCKKLTSINVNNFDVSKVTNASAMFGNCTSLTTITCDNAWDIETAVYMFDGCGALKNEPKNVTYSSL